MVGKDEVPLFIVDEKNKAEQEMIAFVLLFY